MASNIPHDNQEIEPEHRNAIDLWEYTKNVAPAFNCRLHSILTFELMLAAGLEARYVTCLPEDEDDNDCHVVNEVWLPELGKWAMIDSDMGGHYICDVDAQLPGYGFSAYTAYMMKSHFWGTVATNKYELTFENGKAVWS